MSGDPLLTRSQLAKRGVSDSEIRQALRSGSIAAVRRGCFVGRSALLDATPEMRHLLTARAVVTSGGSDLVLSHESAAVLWGLPLLGGPPDKVHVTATNGRRGRVGPDRYLHCHKLGGDDTTVHAGIRVTSPARTVVDLACYESFEAAVCAGDAASLHYSDLAAAVERSGQRAGIARARRVAAFVDGRSESVGESRSRVYFDRFDVPAPDLQVEIVVDGKTYRVDFLWDGVVGEFDGLTKYAGDQGSDAVVREKLREDALRAAGYVVIRWTWADLADGRLARRVLAALAVG
ncbi:hypothetical protein RhoFasK5_00797|nr:hypothetical protein A3Q40_03550 [Rhodococcus sp. PBTS 1]NIL79796.1 hypothetical protein [Rhodococcus kroppenstedtii]